MASTATHSCRLVSLTLWRPAFRGWNHVPRVGVETKCCEVNVSETTRISEILIYLNVGGGTISHLALRGWRSGMELTFESRKGVNLMTVNNSR